MEKEFAMILTEKETTEINNLRTQEARCVEKYKRGAKEAKDPVLKALFETIEKDEQDHYNALDELLTTGKVPVCECKKDAAKSYAPKATYHAGENTSEKESDCYLASDCIGAEKMVSGEYNNGVFVFGDSGVRQLLGDIQSAEQNHADMLWKYKTTNGMQG